MTPLDVAHAEAEATEVEADRRAFWGLIAASELHLWLEAEPEGDELAPRLFEVDGIGYALAFDAEDRLAGFADGPAPYATLPGRRLAALLAASGLGLGLNFGAPSGSLLPPDHVAWLAEMGAAAPRPDAGHPVELSPPALSESLLLALDRRLAAAEGLFSAAWLAGAMWEDGRAGQLLALEEAVPGAAGAIARFVTEAVAFAGEAVEIDVAAVTPGSPLATRLARVALRFDPPQPDPVEPRDPNRPPRLR